MFCYMFYFTLSPFQTHICTHFQQSNDNGIFPFTITCVELVTTLIEQGINMFAKIFCCRFGPLEKRLNISYHVNGFASKDYGDYKYI